MKSCVTIDTTMGGKIIGNVVFFLQYLQFVISRSGVQIPSVASKNPFNSVVSPFLSNFVIVRSARFWCRLVSVFFLPQIILFSGVSCGY